MKKKAKQARSRNTVQLILEAASQVLVSDGYHGASTNHIAERAGFSIGTLYQYFDDKEDIFRELLEQFYTKLHQSVVECPAQPTLRQLLEAYNISLSTVFNDDPDLIQALGSLVTNPFLAQRIHWRGQVIDAFVKLLHPHRSEIICKSLPVAATVLVCASEGLGSVANSELFQPEGFQPHLLRLQLAYLTTEIE